MAIGTPAYRRTVERMAAASMKAKRRKRSKTNVMPEGVVLYCKQIQPRLQLSVENQGSDAGWDGAAKLSRADGDREE